MAISLSLALVCCGEEESTSSPDSTPESITVSVSESESESESESLSVSVAEKHNLTHVPYRDANCRRAGNIDYWQCKDCDKYFSDSAGKTEITKADTVIAQLAHTVYFVEGEDSTCEEEGILSHYACETCPTLFSDDKGANRISEKDLTVAKKPHEMIHNAGVLAKGNENGKLEHWQCDICKNLYADDVGDEKIEESDITTPGPFTLVDFVVEVPTNRNPIVLQLSDTQIIYAENARPGRTGVSVSWSGSDKKEERCYKYLTETINATNPDLIIITGDIVYGEFDDTGVALLYLIEFMESFNIPWAPVFGNHDNESEMGVDWQCEQFEKAENCLFKQRELTGNGNYSVGIAQGGYITRTFYMLDSNGCGNAHANSLANKHTRTSQGFASDQIEWYTDAIIKLKKSAPSVKISFAYHIQQAVFAKAYEKYGFVQDEATMKAKPINIDKHPNKADTDFGYIGRAMKGPWDTNFVVFNGMVALGVDSIFVGHEHCNNASVVYQGIRFQYGQKSSEYDRYNCVKSDGTIISGGSTPVGAKSLMGGTVIPLDEKGEIVNPYVYYCGDVFGTNPTV